MLRSKEASLASSGVGVAYTPSWILQRAPQNWVIGGEVKWV